MSDNDELCKVLYYNYMVFLSKVPIQGSDDTTWTTEAEYSINSCEQEQVFA